MFKGFFIFIFDGEVHGKCHESPVLKQYCLWIVNGQHFGLGLIILGCIRFRSDNPLFWFISCPHTCSESIYSSTQQCINPGFDIHSSPVRCFSQRCRSRLRPVELCIQVILCLCLSVPQDHCLPACRSAMLISFLLYHASRATSTPLPLLTQPAGLSSSSTFIPWNPVKKPFVIHSIIQSPFYTEIQRYCSKGDPLLRWLYFFTLNLTQLA